MSYNDKGHMSVTFRNDVIGTDGFKAFDPTDRYGCKRRCMEMLAYSGCELSEERIIAYPHVGEKNIIISGRPKRSPACVL